MFTGDDKLSNGIWVVKDNSYHRLTDLEGFEKDKDYYITLSELKYKYREAMIKALMENWDEWVTKTYTINERNEVMFSLPSVTETVDMMLKEVARKKVETKLEEL